LLVLNYVDKIESIVGLQLDLWQEMKLFGLANAA